MNGIVAKKRRKDEKMKEGCESTKSVCSSGAPRTSLPCHLGTGHMSFGPGHWAVALVPDGMADPSPRHLPEVAFYGYLQVSVLAACRASILSC